MSNTAITPTYQKDMIQSRCSFGITCDKKNKEVYVFGGYGNTGFLNHCEKYSFDMDQWTELRQMIKKKSNVSACIVDNKFVYAVGGSTQGWKAQNDIEKFSIEFNSWEAIQIAGDQQMPNMYLGFTFQISPSSIIIAGGNCKSKHLKFCYTLDIVQNTLKKVSYLPNQELFLSSSALIISDKMYVVGFQNNFIYQYSLTTGNWKTVHQF